MKTSLILKALAVGIITNLYVRALCSWMNFSDYNTGFTVATLTIASIQVFYIVHDEIVLRNKK